MDQILCLRLDPDALMPVRQQDCVFMGLYDDVDRERERDRCWQVCVCLYVRL